MQSSMLSEADIVRALPVNNMLFTRNRPTNLVVERIQKKSYSESFSSDTQPGQHIITNSQTGVEFVDPLQSFVHMKITAKRTASTTATTAHFRGSALNVISDSQHESRSGKELDRIQHLDKLNYHRVNNEGHDFSRTTNLKSLILMNHKDPPTNTRLVWDFQVGKTEVTKEVMIPLKYISGLFDGNENSKLLLPHLMRGLKSDLTLQSFDTAFTTSGNTADEDASTYTVTDVYYLFDSYRVLDSVLSMLNERYASKSGLVQEFYTYYGDSRTMLGTANIEVRRAVSQAVDCLLVTDLVSNISSKNENSYASTPVGDGDTSQWRIGSQYTTNAPVKGIIEHYAQSLYYAQALRGCKDVAYDYNDFATDLGSYPGIMARNNVIAGSGVAINNSMTLSVDLKLDNVDNKNVYTFLRHARRAVCFLENIKIEL